MIGTLARQAAAGNRQAFLGLREQVRECHQLGIGQALAGLLEEGAHADFLQPFALALRTLAGEEVSSAAPREVAALAEEVSVALRKGTLSSA